MKTKVLCALFAIISSMQLAQAAPSEIQIPRSMPGDKGKYFLIDLKKSGGIITTLHKRIGVSETGYSKTEINCKTNQYRDMGYSEEGADKIKILVGKWTELVPGSSKSDMVNFVCAMK